MTKKPKKIKVHGFTTKHTCAECHKRFEKTILGGEWGWNIGQKLFCTYGCMREYERKEKEKRFKKYEEIEAKRKGGS